MPFREGELLWQPLSETEWKLVNPSLVDLSILRDSGIETVDPRRRHGQGEAAKAATLARAGPFREGGLLWQPRSEAEWELVNPSLVDLSILRDRGIETVDPRRRHGQGEAAKATTLARAGPFEEGGGYIRRLARWLVREALRGALRR